MPAGFTGVDDGAADEVETERLPALRRRSIEGTGLSRVGVFTVRARGLLRAGPGAAARGETTMKLVKVYKTIEEVEYDELLERVADEARRTGRFLFLVPRTVPK